MSLCWKAAPADIMWQTMIRIGSLLKDNGVRQRSFEAQRATRRL